MSKYGNKEVTIDGIKFHSKSEGAYYLHLKKREERGEISNLSLQPSFVIIPRYKRKDGTILSVRKYVADFMFNEGDKTVVVDVKGAETKDFKLKARLFRQLYEQYEFRVISAEWTVKYGWETIEEKKKRKKVKK